MVNFLSQAGPLNFFLFKESKLPVVFNERHQEAKDFFMDLVAGDDVGLVLVIYEI